MNVVDRNTVMCMSLAARPGEHGNRFHNYLYDELGLNYLYKSFTSTDIEATIGGIRSLGIRGVGVSMPYKEAVIPYLDALDASARSIESVNTIVNDNGVLTGYNTDFIAVRLLLDQYGIGKESQFALYGSGGMAKAMLAALADAGFTNGVVVASRAVDKAQRLAARYGITAVQTLGDRRPQLLLNATPVGMAGAPEADLLAFPPDVIAACDVVFDVVYLPRDTPLVTHASLLGKTVITGDLVMAHQSLEQFVLYTGVRPTLAQVENAEAFAVGV